MQCYFGSSGLAVSILRSMQTEKLQRKPNKKSGKIWWLTKQHFLFSKFSFWKRLFVKSHLSQPGTFLSDSFIQFFYKSLCRFPFIIYECKLWKLFLNTRCTTTVQRPNFLPQWSCLFSLRKGTFLFPSLLLQHMESFSYHSWAAHSREQEIKMALCISDLQKDKSVQIPSGERTYAKNIEQGQNMI